MSLLQKIKDFFSPPDELELWERQWGRNKPIRDLAWVEDNIKNYIPILGERIHLTETLVITSNDVPYIHYCYITSEAEVAISVSDLTSSGGSICENVLDTSASWEKSV